MISRFRHAKQERSEETEKDDSERRTSKEEAFTPLTLCILTLFKYEEFKKIVSILYDKGC